MKIAILSESPGNEIAIAAIIEAILGRPFERLGGARPRAGGFGAIPGVLEPEFKHLYFNVPDADAMVIVADADDSPPHDPAAVANPCAPDCRRCAYEGILESCRRKVPQIGRKPLLTAVGIAIPAIEAWMLCGTDPHIVEHRFIRERQATPNLANHRRELKARLYGTIRPSPEDEIHACEAACRSLADRLHDLRRLFPNGFGPLHDAVAAWR